MMAAFDITAPLVLTLDGKQMVYHKGYVIWPVHDDTGWHTDITDGQGKQIHSIADGYALCWQAVNAARDWIDENK